jgi:hypothetical protein
MFENIRAGIIVHKYAVIAAAAATVLLTVYVVPFDSLLGTASAQNGPNENRFKVCEKPFGDPNKPGNQDPPKKCYGITD